MSKGTVRWFNDQKGYGFIVDSESKEVFVHWKGIISEMEFKSLTEGQSVEFDIIDTEKGRQAINVTVVEKTSKEDFEKIVDTINSYAQKVEKGEE